MLKFVAYKFYSYSVSRPRFAWLNLTGEIWKFNSFGRFLGYCAINSCKSGI